MAQVMTASVDMILCDLPYGTTACKWDAVIPFEPLWEHYRRIIKPNGAIALFANEPFTSALVMSAPKLFRHEWIWHKNRATGHLDAKRRPMRAHESILVFGIKSPRYFPQKTTGHKPGNIATRRTNNRIWGKETGENTWGGTTERYPRSVQEFACVNNDDPIRTHPTQKPVALLEFLIRTYTLPGETVLDNCMGSGSTGAACKTTGRNFIGIEKDPIHFITATRRLCP
jgi:site-specific DNA-methyltransferase (adenine-specific)